MSAKSDTPRTDANRFYLNGDPKQCVVHDDFARQLERELAAANHEIARLENLRDLGFADIKAMAERSEKRYKELADSQDREERLRRALEDVVENGPCSDPDCCEIAIKCAKARDRASQALSAAPSGQRFVRREVLENLEHAVSFVALADNSDANPEAVTLRDALKETRLELDRTKS